MDLKEPPEASWKQPKSGWRGPTNLAPKCPACRSESLIISIQKNSNFLLTFLYFFLTIFLIQYKISDTTCSEPPFILQSW